MKKTLPNAATLFDDRAFAIRFEPARKLVEIVMHGYWDAAIVKRYDHALRCYLLPAMTAGGCPVREQVTIFDTTDFLVQSPETLGLLRQMANDPSIASRRFAILMSSALLRMQAKRTFPDFGLFDDRDEAIRWLLEPGA